MPRLLSLILCLLCALVSACGDAGSGVSFGGAQDIGRFREVLDQGEIPGERTLDANGFFNEHHIPLPAADCGKTLCLHSMLAIHRDWVWSDYQAVIEVNLNSPIDAATLTRPPLSLVAVIDTSASMKEDEKLDRVREGLHLLIDGLLPEDRLGIVSYGTEVHVLADVQSAPDPATLHAAADNLVAEGSTNLHEGLKAGLDMSAKAFSGTRQSRLILLSDGVPTRGVTDTAEIIEMADTYFTKGIALTTVGVGFEFDGALMKQLAEHGAGSFYYIEDAAAVKDIFADELGYFLTPIALDLDIDVVAGSAYEVGEVFGASGWTIDKRTAHIHVPAVFLSSRSEEMAGDSSGRRGGGSALFLSMIPTKSGAIAESRVGLVTMKYRTLDSDIIEEQSADASSPFPVGSADEEPFFSQEVMAKSYAMYNLFLGLRGAARTAHCNFDCSKWSLLRLRDRATIWNATRNDEDIAADIALAETFAGNIDAFMEKYHAAPSNTPIDRETCMPCRDGDCCIDDNACAAARGTRGTRDPSGSSGLLWALIPLALAAGVARGRRRSL